MWVHKAHWPSYLFVMVAVKNEVTVDGVSNSAVLMQMKISMSQSIFNKYV